MEIEVHPDAGAVFQDLLCRYAGEYLVGTGRSLGDAPVKVRRKAPTPREALSSSLNRKLPLMFMHPALQPRDAEPLNLYVVRRLQAVVR